MIHTKQKNIILLRNLKMRNHIEYLLYLALLMLIGSLYIYMTLGMFLFTITWISSLIYWIYEFIKIRKDYVDRHE